MDKIYYEDVYIRRFNMEDIEKKIAWINDPKNNKYLHYDLPLEYDKTLIWYKKIRSDNSRFDCTVIWGDIPIGLIGLLNIDFIDMKSEYYITIGEEKYKGKGIAKKASKAILNYAFYTLCLEKVYLYVEKDNIIARKMYEKLNFMQRDILENYLLKNNEYLDIVVYELPKNEYIKIHN